MRLLVLRFAIAGMAVHGQGILIHGGSAARSQWGKNGSAVSTAHNREASSPRQSRLVVRVRPCANIAFLLHNLPISPCH